MKPVLKTKRKKQKLTTLAFTLVELLAVIIVLAIILIIAVPGVLGIIRQAKDKTQEQQRQMIEEAGRLYVTTDPDVVWIGQETETTVVTLDMLKAKGYVDKKIVDPKTKKEITCAKLTAKKMGRKFEYQMEFCDQVNASPRLSSNMIPIRYDGSKWVKADYTNQDKNWYDYDNQQWANMAITTEATREAYQKADSETEVKMADILSMYTWIPRFKYRLWSVDGTVGPTNNPNMDGDYTISVELETANTPKSKGTQNGEWLTHPAFTFGGQELEGFWVGKFLNGYKGATGKLASEKNETNPAQLIIKPNAYAWRLISGKNMFDTITGLTKAESGYGLESIHDPHLMKNMEWGAVAYLGYSKYGKSGNPNYSGLEREVRKNANWSYMTGCGATAQNIAASGTCEAYETANGQAASTTGNITGIYDMSGKWAYIAGVMKDENGNMSVAASEFDQKRLNQLGQEGKYFDVYEYSTDWADRSRAHLGDATIETGPVNILRSTWYNDYASFVYKHKDYYVSWFTRGAGNVDLETAGLMEYGYSTGIVGGAPWEGGCFRTVIL